MRKSLIEELPKIVVEDRPTFDRLDLNPLTSIFSGEQIEAALIGLYISKNKLSTKNLLLKELLLFTNSVEKKEIQSFLERKKIPLDLMTIQKVFELLLERDHKKKTGTFYTPYSLVNFITNQSVYADSTVLDTSCGCGAFLIGAVHRLISLGNKDVIEILEKKIFGVDISTEAIRRAKIMLTLTALMYGYDKEKITFNLVRSNALELDWKKQFPAIFQQGGFDVVLGNPPYGSLPSKSHTSSLFTKSKNVNLDILFTYLMVKLVKKNGRGGLVLPLSISFSSAKAMGELRTYIEDSKGIWKFSFYDRSPASLFGDSVKTRNCIVLFSNTVDVLEIHSTKLIRWNSNNYHKIFCHLPYQKLLTLDIKEGIPKISTRLEFDVLKKIHNPGGLKASTKSVRELKSDNNVYFYNTAYNWLSVFRKIPPSYDSGKKLIVPTSLGQIKCKSTREAQIVYALLNSTFAYWYWVVWGDGFHVTAKFIKNVPISVDNFTENAQKELSALASKLIFESLKHSTSKVNSGKTIGNFNMLKNRAIIRDIDKIIVRELKINPQFLGFLDSFYREHISAGRINFKNSNFLTK